MKSTGIVRQMDQLGRISVPVELRRTLNIEEKDHIEIFTDVGGKIILKKYQPGCTFCDNPNVVRVVHGKNICNVCLGQLQ